MFDKAEMIVELNRKINHNKRFLSILEQINPKMIDDLKWYEQACEGTNKFTDMIIYCGYLSDTMNLQGDLDKLTKEDMTNE